MYTNERGIGTNSYFQLVLASNGKRTFAILRYNYINVDAISTKLHADNECFSFEFATKQRSSRLDDSTTTGRIGVFIHDLTPPNCAHEGNTAPNKEEYGPYIARI